MQPKVIFLLDPETGSRTVTTVDLLEDFWFDYLFFHRDARAASRHRDPLKVHRYVRASLFSLLNYLTGLINRWQAEVEGLKPEPLGGNLGDRFAALSKQLGGAPPPGDELASLVALATRCANLQPSDEADLFSALSLEAVEAAEQKVIAWLEDFCRSAGLPRHAETRSVGFSFEHLFGTPTHESYQSFDALAGDPHPFQDDPEGWGGPVEQQPRGKDQG